ncbi:MAG: hypothetical protein J0M24_09600, partial [Verrucomicrobia bacterium]|nr:hypothetical protein [Verrucomicrobiota bacterium]
MESRFLNVDLEIVSRSRLERLEQAVQDSAHAIYLARLPLLGGDSGNFWGLSRGFANVLAGSLAEVRVVATYPLPGRP